MKDAGPEGDRVRKARPGEQERAMHATTHYSVIDRVGQKAAWVSLKPVTGRQHQLRAHLAAIGHPIVGDPKYPYRETAPAQPLHLLARGLTFRHPRGHMLTVAAPLPPHMRATFVRLGFAAS